MVDDVATRAARGAALLDERMPGWAQRIDVGRLDLADGCNCVLGQLFTEYYLATRPVLGLGVSEALDAAIGCGFHAVDSRQFSVPTAAWRHEIALRLAPSVQEQVEAALRRGV